MPNEKNRLDETAASQTPQPPAAAEVGELTERQRVAAEMMALGKSHGSILRTLEIDRKTLYNWRRLPAFKVEVEQYRNLLWRDAADRLRGLVYPALEIVEGHLHDKYERIRFRAATTVLRMANLKAVTPPAKDLEQSP